MAVKSAALRVQVRLSVPCTTAFVMSGSSTACIATQYLVCCLQVPYLKTLDETLTPLDLFPLGKALPLALTSVWTQADSIPGTVKGKVAVVRRGGCPLLRSLYCLIQQVLRNPRLRMKFGSKLCMRLCLDSHHFRQIPANMIQGRASHLAAATCASRFPQEPWERSTSTTCHSPSYSYKFSQKMRRSPLSSPPRCRVHSISVLQYASYSNCVLHRASCGALAPPR